VAQTRAAAKPDWDGSRDRRVRYPPNIISTMSSEPDAPTRDGARQGRDSTSGVPWAFESPEAHWAEHDRRQVRYWRSRPPAERLARAAHYRALRHGRLFEPVVWTWRFLGPGER
jgi:hypothetical protein